MKIIIILLALFGFIFRFDLFIKYFPNKFLGFFPLFWDFPIPFTKYVLWMGQLYNLWVIIFIIYLIYQIRKNKLFYKNWLFRKNATYLISWKTGKWKTRLLTQIARDCVSNNTIICSNFYHWYDKVFYSSFKDFCLLQIDISLLWEATNFIKEEKKIISKYFPDYFTIIDKDISEKVKKIKWKYHFITLWDEFYAYLHSRSFMSNFAKWEWKTLLMNLHQTRHSNQTLILASQDTDNLDLDLRQLAHNELNVKSWLLDIFYGFDIHTYLTKKEQKENGIEYIKNNKIPYFFFNSYIVYNFLNKIFNQYQTFYIKIRKKININFQKDIKNLEFLKWNFLDYNTKFNVKLNINSYKSGDLFDYILEKEKNNLTKKI